MKMVQQKYLNSLHLRSKSRQNKMQKKEEIKGINLPKKNKNCSKKSKPKYSKIKLCKNRNKVIISYRIVVQ